MKVFLINLDQDKERLASARQQLTRLDVAFERVSAVYAKAMPVHEKGRHVSSFRWWCATGRKPRDGEIGCALSHQSVYRKMIEEKMDWACVLEDDVTLDARFKEVLSFVQQNGATSTPAVYLLSNHSDPVGQSGLDSTGFVSPSDAKFEFKQTWWDLCTEGYVVNMAGAKALLRADYPLITPCDQWMRWARLHVVDIYHVFPTVCGQNKSEFDSTTVEGFVAVDSLPFCKKMVHKALRVVGVCIDRQLNWITGK